MQMMGLRVAPGARSRGRWAQPSRAAPSTLAGAQRVNAGIKPPSPPEHFFQPNPGLQDPKGISSARGPEAPGFGLAAFGFALQMLRETLGWDVSERMSWFCSCP